MAFEEQQQLKLWWLYLLLGIETIIIASILLVGKNALSFKELKDAYFAPFFAILLPYVLIYLFNKSSLKVVIDQNGIEYQYWPFSRKKLISWKDINDAHLRKYDALGEYGGWGVKQRLWFKKHDKAYIFNDQPLGLQLYLANGEKILFSTEKPDELNLFLINLKRSYQIAAINTDVR